MMAGMAWKGNRVVPVLLGGVAVVFAAVMALGLAFAGHAQGSHAFDPSDGSNFNTYSLVNDLKRPVNVYLCTDATCSALNPRSAWIPLAPGASVEEQEYWDTGVQYGFKIAVSPRGRRCLVVDASSQLSGTVAVPLSSAGACPVAPAAS
jgi:hypothetical protein